MKSFPARIQKTGIILNVKNYQKCVRFYSDKLGFNIHKQKPNLTIFDFGAGYLLVEHSPKNMGWKNGALRIHVADVPRTAEALSKKGLKINVYSTDWGDVGELHDPEGNRIELCKWH